jgi:hypothetical protein
MACINYIIMTPVTLDRASFNHWVQEWEISKRVMVIRLFMGKGKGKGHPRTGHEGSDEE